MFSCIVCLILSPTVTDYLDIVIIPESYGSPRHKSSNWKSMWFLGSTRNHLYGVRCKAALRKMPSAAQLHVLMSINCMLACRLGLMIMGSSRDPITSHMVLSKGVYLHRPYLTSCWQMPMETKTYESTSYIVVMENCLILNSISKIRKSDIIPSMTWMLISVPQLLIGWRKIYRKTWISYWWRALGLGLASTRRHKKSCTNLLQRKHTEPIIRVNSENLKAVQIYIYRQCHLRTWPLMMKSIP